MSSIATNMGSIIAQSNLKSSQKAMQSSLQKLSSGFRINSAADDAAGLAITEKMRAQISGLNTASNNAQNAISLMQSAEGAMSQTTSILQRMRELAVQSASDTNTGSDRVAIQQEVDGLAAEISRISNTTEFNTQNLLAGGLNSKFQIGANQGQNVGISIGAMDAQTLGVAGKLNIKSGATTAVGNVGASLNLNDGLTAQQYGLRITVFSGTSGSQAINAQSTGYAGTTGFYSGQFSGQVDTTFKIRVDSVVGLSLASGAMVSISTDGGATWGASQAYSSGMSLGAGTGIGYIASGGTAVAGDMMSATFKAYTATFQLLDTNSGAVGTSVTVNNLATAATVGDTSTLQTMDIRFFAANSLAATVSGVTAASGIFQAVGQLASTAATTSNGVVTQAATVLRGIDVSSAATAGKAITAIDKALSTINASRANLGAMQNRLTYTMNNLSAAATNLQAAESAIRDTDMAAEMSNFTKNQILSQAGVSMLAQANQDPQTVLKLLQ